MEDKKLIINRDICGYNIGLDENLGAKIVAFGCSALLPPNQDEVVNLEGLGRSNYIDPEYEKTDKLKRESDVYGFGVVLFEILCGRRACDPINKKESDKGLAYLARQSLCTGTLDDMIDPIIKEGTSENNFVLNKVPNKDSLDTFIDIAHQCVTETQDKRPTMKVVVKQLEKALLFQVHSMDRDAEGYGGLAEVAGDIQQLSNKYSETVKQVHYPELSKHTEQDPVFPTDKILSLGSKQSVLEHPKQEAILEEHKVNNFQHLKIPLTHILSATKDFSITCRIAIHDGVQLYRAELEHYDKDKYPSKRHNTVFIKRYPSDIRHQYFGEKRFLTEIEILSSGVKHPNIVTLLGFCLEDSEMILVIDYFSNGFLGEYLGNFKDKQFFTWEKRLKICIDVAYALRYIHYEMEDQKIIINRDICSYNIGLDENMGAKIVSFKDFVFLPPNQEDEAVYLNNRFGRDSYRDPQYEKTGKLKRESDVYSFGVVLFEILCGRLSYDPIYLEDRQIGLAHVVRRSFSAGTLEEMIDPIIKEEISENGFVLQRGPNKDSLHMFITIAHQCVSKTQDQRPTMEVVVSELEKALFFQKNNKDNPKMLLEEIKRATQNFNNDNCIGGGGFGRVYKGNLQDGDGFKTIVAKRLDTMFGQGEQQFLCELQILLDYKHENVIGLVGYCDEIDEKVIISEYASRGSLDKYLNDASLTWVKRLNICIDVTSALYFFHGGGRKQAKVIHRDIKPANILLNHDWKAKLADFGLSLISPLSTETDYVIDHACGTTGYLDPVYEKSRFLTIESDIYSFGVVLFEMLCGRSTFKIHEREGHYLPDFIMNKFDEGKRDEVVFRQIKEQMEPRSLSTFQKIAYRCLHHEREERPTTNEVLVQLRKALAFQNMTSTMTMFAPLRIPLEDVVNATNNFHDDYIIQHNGIGTTYKGRLLWSGKEMQIVARRFDCEHGEGDLKFLKEISVLSDFKHTNLVSIIGFSDEKIIITTYEATGSLRQYINSSNVTWTQVLRICVGLSHALSYLHYDEGRDYGIIHCNITSDTILLDENGEAKLSGFEFSVKHSVYYKDQVCPYEYTGCVDPSVKKTGGVTHKSDIYSLGVVLFEILCRKKTLIQNEEAGRSLAELAKYHYENGTLHDIINPHLLYQILSPQSLLIYSKVAYACLNEYTTHRPDMHYITSKLENALELQSRGENIENKFGHLRISLSAIHLATNDFSEAYIIASRKDAIYTLYRAKLHKDRFSSKKGKKKGEHPRGHRIVVIKRYTSRKWYGGEDLFIEIEMLMSVEHPNIVTLIGYCIEHDEMILVTENFSNGYLGDYLGNVNDMRILTWEKRLKICIDVAHALKYLHCEMEDQKMVIHRDICSYTIGLDNNLGARIVEFKASVLLPQNQEDDAISLKWFGRPFYIDPDYKQTNKVKRESDVYSFGIVLFEVLCGRFAYDPIYMNESDKGLAHVARRSFSAETLENMIDPILKEEINENFMVLNRGLNNKDSLHTFMKIAYQCVAESQDQRPTMEVVVKELEKALFFQNKNKDKPKFSLEDIKLATQNFHDDNCIGREGDGKVYKGNLQDGVYTIVAKRLDTSLGQGEKQFLSQLQILWEYKHENVIGFLGYCDEHDEKIIVYEHASRRSLDRYLNDVCLTWVKRLSICIDIARALAFLHGGRDGKQAKVIHRDIKPVNILLNHDWKAKLADFGLSLICPLVQETKYVIDHVCGTPGYLDPLYSKSGFLTVESDIYSFGVVMFEILCGRSTSAIHEDEGHHLPDFIKNNFEQGKHDEVVFEQITKQIMPKSLTAFQEIAYKCLHNEREKRPTADEVLFQLSNALKFQHRRYIQRKKKTYNRKRSSTPNGPK